MRKWLYQVAWGPLADVNKYSGLFEQPELEIWLNELGREGWELVKLDTKDPPNRSVLRSALSGKLQWVGVFKREAGEVERL